MTGSPENLDRLVELAAPYRGIRKFIYMAVGGSGAIGGVIFFFRVLAGRDLDHSLPNLGLQLGICAITFFLLRWESKAQEQLKIRLQDRLTRQKLNRMP
jgi:hypothetical protein